LQKEKNGKERIIGINIKKQNGSKSNCPSAIILQTDPTTRTRGPRGPWVAHLRKRSKVTVEPITENPRGII